MVIPPHVGMLPLRSGSSSSRGSSLVDRARPLLQSRRRIIIIFRAKLNAVKLLSVRIYVRNGKLEKNSQVSVRPKSSLHTLACNVSCECAASNESEPRKSPRTTKKKKSESKQEQELE